jgi:predicted phosphohydrolase
MKLRVVSDLHLDFHADGGRTLVKEITAGDFDILIVAGDISAAPTLDRSLRLLLRNTKVPVLYVPGNHDYYSSTWQATLDVLWQAEKDSGHRLHVMLDSLITSLENQVFLGTTLWFPWTKTLPEDAQLGDFHHIRDFRQWVGKIAGLSANFLRTNVESDMVVITHHLPHPACVAPRYAGSPLNRYFVHDLGDEVVSRPKLWIHGHTHDSVDMRVGDCRVVCNPFGYAGMEENPKFRPDFDVVV